MASSESPSWTHPETGRVLDYGDLRSPVKFLVLETVEVYTKRDGDGEGEVGPTYERVARELDAPAKRISWYLTQYRRQGLVAHETYALGAGAWTLTEHGAERLDWMRDEIASP